MSDALILPGIQHQEFSMKTAFSTWNNRIAPVFDVARKIHVVEADAGRVIRETRESMVDDMPIRKALRLAELGINALVCGAISRPLEALIKAHGIQVIPFVAGDLSDVIQAWLCGRLEEALFAMPGSCRKGPGRRWGANRKYQEEYVMNGRVRGGAGRGGGQRKGQTGQRQARMRGPSAGNNTGNCLCPSCGYREPHKRGVPCIQNKCPECGAVMSRE
jgi:predicted Fe-Mo cluster-binding NifX family protein